MQLTPSFTDKLLHRSLLYADILRRNEMYNRQPPADSTGTPWEIILEKIDLPAPTGSIRRPRLNALLEQSLRSCTSTIINGRAGSGKTALAIDFAEESGRVVAWYKVDAPETKLVIFFQYLIASINTQRPGFGNYGLKALLQLEPDLTQIARLAELFIFELELHTAKPLLVVIEDLHLVCDADWLVPFFRRLLPLLPTDVHVLITSRTMPPAPLWRLRSKQTLFVIDEETLSFTRDEAVQLFEHYGLEQDQANIALDHSRGRAAALSSLAAMLRFAESEVTSSGSASSQLSG